MKLEQLRARGSQALDDMAEFIITNNSILIYEQCGNGIYHLEKVYKIIKKEYGHSFIDMEIGDVARIKGGVVV